MAIKPLSLILFELLIDWNKLILANLCTWNSWKCFIKPINIYYIYLQANEVSVHLPATSTYF